MKWRRRQFWGTRARPESPADRVRRPLAESQRLLALAAQENQRCHAQQERPATARDDERQAGRAALRQLAELRQRYLRLQQEAAAQTAELRQLRRLPAQLQQARDQLQYWRQRSAELTRRLKALAGVGPAFKNNTPSALNPCKRKATDRQRARRGGARPGHPGHGPRALAGPDLITETFPAAPPECDRCHGHRLEALGQEEQTYLHYVPARLEKRRRLLTFYRCRHCGRIVTAAPPDLLRGQQYDNAFIAEATVQLFGDLETYRSTARRLELLPGTLHQLLDRTARQCEPLFKLIEQQLLKAPIVQADETGLRNDGRPGYVWFFGTRRERVYLFRMSRSSAIPKELFDPAANWSTILVTDRHGGYNQLHTFHQYCYAHLLRDFQRVRAEAPRADRATRCFCRLMIRQLRQVFRLQGAAELDDAQYYARAAALRQALLETCRHAGRLTAAAQGLAQLFLDAAPRLFQWADHRDVPCHNNYAERSLRPWVIARKLSGGCQGNQGMRTREILTTIIQTVLQRGIDPRQFMRRVLATLAQQQPLDERLLDPASYGTVPRAA